MSLDPGRAGERHPLLRIPVPWVFILAYLVGVGLQRVLPAPAGSPMIRLAGTIVFVLGAALAAWCLLLFSRKKTTTTPGETSVALVTYGPYRLSRNPMYVSLTLLYLGEMGILGQVWPLAPLLAVLIYLDTTVIPLEESRLRERFGADYTLYAARVRRWL
jgi:protein-S-isoprenylcysteine O-methyltransferase Ste14